MGRMIFGEVVPESPSHVYELLMEALSEQGRVADFSVADILHSRTTAFPTLRENRSQERFP